MESKPIFVMRLPIGETKSKYVEWLENVSNNLKDYHVLAVMDNRTERVEFECYNVKDYSEVEFNDLKETLTKDFKDTVEKI